MGSDSHPSSRPSSKTTQHVRPFLADFLGEGPPERPNVSGPSHVTAQGNSKVFVGVAQTTSTFNAPVENVHNYFYNTQGGRAGHDSNAEAVLGWLSPQDHTEPYLTALAKFDEGTGQWFLESSVIQKWFTEGHALLWLHGGVGTGKTTLCAAVVKKGEERCRANLKRRQCFFFFSSQDPNRRSLEPLQRSLIGQFCTSQSILEPLRSLYSECHKTYPARKPSRAELTAVLAKTLRSLDEDVFVFVDALDEIPFAEREEVTSFLAEIAGLKLAHLHLFVTSRNEPDIEQALNYPIRWVETTMREEEVNADIDIYVTTFLESSTRLRNQEKRTKDLIRRRLVSQGGSMFRWAALQLAMLTRMRVINYDTVDRALAQLPKDLNETYSRMLIEIEPRMSERARRALLWLTVATRPLYIEEITEACLFQFGASDDFESSRTSFKGYNLFEVLRDLVSITPRILESETVADNCHRVQLAHASVREFLIGDDVTASPACDFAVRVPDAHTFVAKSCLSYLFHYNSRNLREARYPLRQYAWYNWELHVLPDSHHEVSGNSVRQLAMDVFQTLLSQAAVSGTLPNSTPGGYAASLGLLQGSLGIFVTGMFEALLGNLSVTGGSSKSIARRGQMQTALDMILALSFSDSERLKDSLKWPFFFPAFDRYQPSPDWIGRGPGVIYNTMGKTHIRLLRVLPCLDKNAELLCILHYVDLREHPDYQAVSYRWNHDKTKGATFIDGYKANIMPHLTDMLRRMRGTKEDAQPSLWIDSLSINQEDMEEKYLQVNLMPEIYATAKECLVYLDSQEDMSNSVSEFKLMLPELCSTALAWSMATDSFSSIPPSQVLPPAPPIDENRLEGILALFRHPYWERLWIVQEIVLASTATIFYDETALDLSSIEAFADAAPALRGYWLETGQGRLVRRLDGHPGWQAVQDICLTRKQFRQGIRPSLPSLVFRFARHTTVSPQDKLFAMTALASDGPGSVNISPDYTLGQQEVVRRVAEPMLRTSGRLDVLSYWPRCKDDDHPRYVYPSVRSQGPLPSWMPHLLATPLETLPLSPGVFGGPEWEGLYGASNGLPLARKPTSDLNHLVVKGHLVGKVIWTGRLSVDGLRVPSEDKKYRPRELLDLSTTTRTAFPVHIPPDQTLIEVCWRTALADQWPWGKRLTPPRLQLTNRGNWEALFSRNPGQVVHRGCRIPPKTAAEASKLMQLPDVSMTFDLIKGRKYFITSSGFLGLGLDDIEEGDSVVVLHGGDVPYVLRPPLRILVGGGGWEYKGECYVHGIMDGEVITYGLPDGSRPEAQYFELR